MRTIRAGWSIQKDVITVIEDTRGFVAFVSTISKRYRLRELMTGFFFTVAILVFLLLSAILSKNRLGE